MLPVLDIKMFSILRSAAHSESVSYTKVFAEAFRLTSINDRIRMAILERAADLPGKLARAPFSQPAVRDDVVEHLPAIDVLGHKVVVVLEGRFVRMRATEQFIRTLCLPGTRSCSSCRKCTDGARADTSFPPASF